MVSLATCGVGGNMSFCMGICNFGCVSFLGLNSTWPSHVSNSHAGYKGWQNKLGW